MTDRRRWWLAAVLLAIVFAAANIEVIWGRVAPVWDAASFFAPAYTLIADHARAGRILLWNPWQSGGSPDYAEPELGTASPITVAMGAITGGAEAGFRAYWLFVWLLGPLGLLVLARHRGAPVWAGLVVTLGFGFSGFYTGHAEHTSSLYSISFLPWILWRFDVALTSGRVWAAVEAGALWGLSALGGYPQLTILSAGFLTLWAVGSTAPSKVTWGGPPGPQPASRPASEAGRGRPARAWRPAPHVLYRDFHYHRWSAGPWVTSLRSRLGAIVIVVSVGAIVLSPSYVAILYESVGYSDRVGARSLSESVGSNVMEAGALATFSSPYLTTLQASDHLWPDTPISMSNVYLGSLVTIFAVFALVSKPKSLWRWWLVAIAAFFLACAVGRQLPLRGWLYHYLPPTRYFRNPGLFRVYAMFCAAMLALESAKESGMWKRFFLTSTVVSLAAVAAYFHVTSTVSAPLLCVWLGSLAIAAFLLFLPSTRKFLPFLFVALAAADAVLTIRLARPTMYSSEYVRYEWDRIDANHRASLDLAVNGLWRERLPPDWIGGDESNQNIPLRLATLFNFDTLKNRFLAGFAQHNVLVDMSTGSYRLWFAAEAAVLPPTDTFYSAFVKRSEALAAPVLVVHTPEEMHKIAELGLNTPKDLEGVVAISRLPAARQAEYGIVRYTPNHLYLRVSCPQDGWLLVTDRWSPGWRARVNGQATPVSGGNFIFRAVPVKAGENTVEFDYHPAGWPILLILSWGTLAIVVTGSVIKAVR